MTPVTSSKRIPPAVAEIAQRIVSEFDPELIILQQDSSGPGDYTRDRYQWLGQERAAKVGERILREQATYRDHPR